LPPAIGYGLAWLLLATLGTQFGVTHMEAGRASVIIILELVTAVASALWIGGERMSVTAMVGGARLDQALNNSGRIRMWSIVSPYMGVSNRYRIRCRRLVLLKNEIRQRKIQNTKASRAGDHSHG
jgi:hypothetical protein